MHVASYMDCFATENKNHGSWTCYWNAPPDRNVEKDVLDFPSGRIGKPDNYRTLERKGDEWIGPGGLRLSVRGGHPGAGADLEGKTFERYAIAGFEIESDGLYFITGSRLHRPSSKGDAIDVVVHPSAYRPVLRKFCKPGNTIAFDTEVGHLQAGNVIYVAVGPGETSQSDGFEIDFSIQCRDIPSINEQIKQAMAEGRSSIRLIPSRYYVPSNYAMQLEGLTDFEIDGIGVTLITSPDVTGVSVVDCARGHLRGLTIDQDPLPLTQGEVTDIDKDRRWLDLTIDAFYPLPNGATGRNMMFDAATLRQKRPSTGYNFTSIERQNVDTFRLFFEKGGDIPEEIETGDLLSIPSMYKGPNTFCAVSSENMVFENITVHTSAGSGFTEHECSNITYRYLKLTRGPRNPLSSRDRLRTSTSAAFHSRQPRIGPKVLDSLFEWMGDDGFAVDGHWGVVLAYSDNKVDFAARSEELIEKGEPLRFYRWADYSQAHGTVDSFAPSSFKPSEAAQTVNNYYPAFKRWKNYKYTFRATLEKSEDLALKKGDLISFPARNGEGFEFRNNIVREGRSRGLNIKANGIVDGNRFESMQKPGILVYASYGHTSMEAQFVNGLVISNNIIEDCVYMKPSQNALRYSGGISITGNRNMWGRYGHHNIRIENNIIRNVYRGVNLTISNASNVILKGNHFFDTHSHPGGGGEDLGVDNTAVVWMDLVDNVVIEDCRVEGIGPYGNPAKTLFLTENARNVSGSLTVEPDLKKID